LAGRSAVTRNTTLPPLLLLLLARRGAAPLLPSLPAPLPPCSTAYCRMMSGDSCTQCVRSGGARTFAEEPAAAASPAAYGCAQSDGSLAHERGAAPAAAGVDGGGCAAAAAAAASSSAAAATTRVGARMGA
jgi:hypothetical protein